MYALAHLDYHQMHLPSEESAMDIYSQRFIYMEILKRI